jgi:tetratricopeptide (TPR) repeat protein
LSPAFGEALYRHTQGHALFTVEMLRGLQERGDLVQNTNGFWVEGAPVRWAQLPARVEGIIGERLGRLPAALYEMLKVGCVMGDEFIAEVVAQVLKADEREVVRQLSGALDKQHHLVRSQGGQRLGSQRLSHYRFQHILVQSYLYQTIDEAERAYLHEDVGYELEQLYAGQTGAVAVQLARHFREAGLTAKALDYSQQAGEQAARRWANQEAVQFFNDALALLKTFPESSERGRQELRLHMALAEAQWKAGQIAEAMDTFQQSAAIARTLGATEELARAALGFEYVRHNFDLPTEPAVLLLEEARNALGEKDSVLRARVLGNLARALLSKGMPERLEALSKQAIDIARRVGDPLALFDTLYTSVLIQRRWPAKINARIAAVDEMLRLTQEMDDRDSAMQVYPIRILEYLEFGDIQAVDETLESGNQLAEKLQVPYTLHLIQLQRAMRAILAGDFAEGEQLARQALQTGQQMQIETVDGIFGIQMFTIQREKGTLRGLTPVIQSFVERNPEANTWRPGLALIYSDLGFEPEARAQFERLATNDFAGIPQDGLWAGSMAYLSEVCAFLGDDARADILYRLLLPYARLNIVVGGGMACFGAGSHYLGLLAATMFRWTEAEQHFEAALEMNASMGARPWLAHTQVQYAAMLLARVQPGDRDRAHSLLHEALATADELGMKFLVEKVETLKQ